MQLHTAHRDFKDGTPEAGAVLGLLSGKLDIGTDFDKFREKIRGYVETKFDNSKDVICVVTDIEDAMQFLKKNNKTEDLDGEEAKYILKKKRLELALKICINKKRFF